MKISERLDTFYKEDSEKYDVEKVFVAVGVNDIRYSKGRVGHLFNPLNNLIKKIKLYFPHCRVYIHSIIPTKIQNAFTLRNISEFNKLVFNICKTEKCFYVDTFWTFITPGGFSDVSLYSDEVHLKQRE